MSVLPRSLPEKRDPGSALPAHIVRRLWREPADVDVPVGRTLAQRERGGTVISTPVIKSGASDLLRSATKTC